LGQYLPTEAALFLALPLAQLHEERKQLSR
jgi:hypothetical protein